MIGGDINPKVGQDDVKGSIFNAITKGNEQLPLDYLRACNLQTLNARYIKRTGKLWTHMSPNGDKSQTDYILIKNKWKNSALNCEAYNRFGMVGSDHRCVTAKMQLSLRQSKTLCEKIMLHSSQLEKGR